MFWAEHHGTFAAVVINSSLAAFFALVPEALLGFAVKAVSVLVLAMAAELGRRLVSKFFKKESK